VVSINTVWMGTPQRFEDKRRPSLQRIHRDGASCGFLPEEQKLTAGPEVLHRFGHATDELVVAYIAARRAEAP